MELGQWRGHHLGPLVQGGAQTSLHKADSSDKPKYTLGS
jgi:hypothetical protein